MFDLKTDPDLPYHYLIGVCMKDLTSSDPGKLFLKYGPVYLTNKDIEEIQECLILMSDKIYTAIYKMKKTEIYNNSNCKELVSTISFMKIACQANHCTMHHFSSEVEIKNADKFFDEMVERCNYDQTEKKRLIDAKTK